MGLSVDHLKFVRGEEGKIAYDECNRFAALATTGSVERNRVKTSTLAQLGLGVFGYPGPREGAEDASIADSRGKGEFGAIARGNCPDDGGENGNADGLFLIMFRWCPFTRCFENRLEERDVLPRSREGGAAGEEPGVVPPAGDGRSCSRADVPLEGFNVGLLGGFYTGAFRDVLRVR